jgi:SAM-dependent methyltransferase
VKAVEDRLLCISPECQSSFPVVDGVPVLINEQTSIFSLEDFTSRRSTTFQLRPGRLDALVHGLLAFLPDISRTVGATDSYATFRDLVLARCPRPKVLVIGGSIEGEGFHALAEAQSIELVATDVSFGRLTALVCDAHDIPFADQTFDGVVAQAVLEHVVDPYRCVEEIHRVVKHGGLVYAATPFMQQVHMGRYDFTRFTHSGHRRLFRRFDEMASGPICGPGMALAWAYQYFLLSFTSSKALRGLIRAFTSLTSFYLKYFDHYLVTKPGAIDSASGFYFIGRRGDTVLPDRDVVKYYKGALSN